MLLPYKITCLFQGSPIANVKGIMAAKMTGIPFGLSSSTGGEGRAQGEMNGRN